MEKGLVAKNLVDANRKTKREERFGWEREIEGSVCVCVCLSVKGKWAALQVPIRRERDIYKNLWLGDKK